MKETFGEYIKLLRTHKGLTLTQLAAQLDLDTANLSKIENGKRDFDIKRIPKLAAVFKLPVQYLKEEFVSDQVAKQVYTMKDPGKLLKAAEEKAVYRKKNHKSSNS